MTRSKTKPLGKLLCDTRRFLDDHGLSSWSGVVKLSLVVDYWAVLHFRLTEYCAESPCFIRVPLRVALLLAKPLVDGLSSSRLRFGAQVGGGLLLHQSLGVLIASGAQIGENCTIYSGVVIAYKGNGRNSGAPRIGDNVRLLTGSMVLGDVVVGDGAVIGANAVVLSDVPPNCTAVGVPARVLSSTA